MRHRPVRRLAAALLNLLFLLAWGEPAMLPPCPTHDGVAGVAAHAAHGAHATARTDHHGTHIARVTSVAVAAAEPPAAPSAEHACRCIGQCCVTATIATPAAQAIRWQVVVRRLAEPAADEPVAPAAIAPRLLPFANGPPATA